MHSEPRNQPSHEYGAPAASLQHLGRPFQWHLRVKRSRDPHEAVPTEQGEQLSAEESPGDDGGKRGRDHRHRLHLAGGDGDAPDGEQEIAGREGQRNAGLLEEEEPADDQGERQPLQALHPANGVHGPILPRTSTTPTTGLSTFILVLMRVLRRLFQESF